MTTRAATRTAAVWTVVRCTGGVTEDLEVEVGPQRGSALSPLLFNTVLRKADRRGWTGISVDSVMFADDIVICSGSREAVEGDLQR